MSTSNTHTSPSFGRRGATGAVSRSGPVRAGATYVVRYGMRTNWIALLILGMAVTSARDLLQPAETGLKVIPLTGMDPTLMWIGTILMGVIGCAWLWQGFSNAVALSLTAQDVSGFTLLGTKTIRWDDVDRLQLRNDDTYGQELIIHAKRGSPSGSIWLNCIPVAVKNVDRPVEEMVSAIQSHRPDLHI